jgi:glycosyltransferase involved in cell wall biosynthesis
MGNYNHSNYLVESIPAILNQTFRPKELIIIDDASTDDSVEVIEKFAKKDPIIRFYKNEKNIGNASTYIKAIEKVTGDYFLVAAADDLIFSELFEKSIKLIEKYPKAGMCSAITMRIDEKGNSLGTSPERPYISKVPCFLPPEKILDLYLKGEDWCIIQTALFRTDAFLELRGFPKEAREYGDGFTAPLLSLNYGGCFIPEVLGYYRVLPNSRASMFRNDPKKFIERMQNVRSLMGSTFYANKFPESFIKSFYKQALYQLGSMSLHNAEIETMELFSYLQSTHRKKLDTLIFSCFEVFLKIQKLTSKLFLFLRLRKISGTIVKRAFYRLML